MLLELKDVTVYYGSAMAVTDISLAQEEGSIVSVIGANGAGKSTILKAINGLVQARSGTIEFDGKRIDGSGTDTIVKAGIACVPESRKLFPYMSVQSNLTLGAYLRKDKQAIQQERARGHSRTLLVLPTGTGKTIVFAKVAEDCVRNGERVLILAHRCAHSPRRLSRTRWSCRCL